MHEEQRQLVARPRPVRSRFEFGGLVLLGAGILAALCGALFLWSGFFDVAATSKHPWPVALLLHYTMKRSVAFQAPHLKSPDLDDPTLILRGAAHYASGCAPCHGAPGELASPIAQQMTPTPPGLYSAGRDFSPSQLFWIIKHGVKMTAMPAWPARQRDGEIWAMVAFVKHLPDYNTERYARITGWNGGTSFLSGMAPIAPGGAFNPAPCGRCHGVDGRGGGGVTPNIAGLDATRFVQVMRAYRDGSKPSGFMQPVAAALAEEQIEEAARYYAALPSKASSP
ncbi:c-type cytochrome [Mesorhizobium sp. ES1-3]|uniref:c-type cytochrome n=1 Tax=Mesorhizobium sp. ES1-3 TaxID=2876628 RepID=UPI001CCB4898|nr:c-type cytochrome [Mesorhizobium sp. ES1-3]MBZ9673671.1 c-type cytochrome [Mesorhizobium sp. ES1-3]